MERDAAREPWTSFLLPVVLIAGLVLLLGFNVARDGGEPVAGTSLEPWLKLLVGYFAAGAEIAAGLVVGLAVLRTMAAYLRHLLRRFHQPSSSIESIRLGLGRALALGLEFTIASDILRTAVTPTPQDIMNLAAIVLLRTLLNYFLEREIRQGEERGAPALESELRTP